jgi:LemA protein
MKDIKTIGLAVLAILAVIILGVFALYTPYNKAISLEESVDAAASDIKVQEKRRVDLVYNLADCVKQYDKHESETLEAIVDGRNAAGDIENVTTAITAVAESYPELKSDENYKQLMNELAITENLIAEYRSNYNSSVKQYNRYVKKPLTKLVLDLTSYDIQSFTFLDYDVAEDAPQNLFED